MQCQALEIAKGAEESGNLTRKHVAVKIQTTQLPAFSITIETGGGIGIEAGPLNQDLQIT